MKKIYLFFFILCLTLRSPLHYVTSLSDFDNYLNSIQALQGNFKQMSPSGELLRGHFAIQKPGRMRLDYAPPSTQIIFTHEGTLYFYDKKTGDLSQTPLDQS